MFISFVFLKSIVSIVYVLSCVQLCKLKCVFGKMDWNCSCSRSHNLCVDFAWESNHNSNFNLRAKNSRKRNAVLFSFANIHINTYLIAPILTWLAMVYVWTAVPRARQKMSTHRLSPNSNMDTIAMNATFVSLLDFFLFFSSWIAVYY